MWVRHGVVLARRVKTLTNYTGIIIIVHLCPNPWSSPSALKKNYVIIKETPSLNKEGVNYVSFEGLVLCFKLSTLEDSCLTSTKTTVYFLTRISYIRDSSTFCTLRICYAVTSKPAHQPL